MKERNDWASLQERIARVARYANAIKGISGLKGYDARNDWDDDYKKAHQIPEVWYKGIRYKWDKRRNKYLHWTTLPNGKKRAEEPPYEGEYPLFGDFSKPFNAFEKEEPNAGEKPLAPMTANHPIGSEKGEKPKQLSLFGESEETTPEKKKTVQKTAPVPKKKEKKEPEKPSARPMSLFDVPSYTDRNEPRDLLSFDNPKQEPDPEQKPVSKEREPQPDRKTKEERLQKIAEKVGQKKKSESGSLKERQLAEILAHNPMSDEYHTGIRTLDDIHTAQEVFNPDDPDAGDYLDLYPDFTLKDAANALKSGYVTIYSSSELKSGTFVTPSRMNAQDYAGGRNAKIFSKKVPINTVAWIDATEGQYCPNAAKASGKPKTKERLRQVVAKVAESEKPLAPMTATGPASHEAKKDQPIQRAEDFESIADEVRSKIMSPEEAKSDKEKTREYIDEVNSYVAIQVKVWDLDAAHSKSLNEYDPKQTYEDFLKNEAEYEQKRSAIWDKIQPIGKKLKAEYMQMSDRESDKNLEFLKAAFPDRGGSTFYYDSDKEYFLTEFKKRGLEKEARRALDVLDVIGRCFNTNNVKRMLPEVVFDKNALNAGYKAGANQIIFPENEEYFKNAQLCALHELGHWFDYQVLGPDEMNETYDWLKSETGIKREQELTADDKFSYQIPVGQSRGLGVHYFGYSETVYPPRRFMDVHGNNRQIRGGTEMVSTAFEYLGYNPEAFAKKNKKHFERTLRWFQKVSETKR